MSKILSIIDKKNNFQKEKYHIMQIIHGGNFRGFRGLASDRESFPANFFLFYYKVFRIAVQSRKFSRD